MTVVLILYSLAAAVCCVWCALVANRYKSAAELAQTRTDRHAAEVRANLAEIRATAQNVRVTAQRLDAAVPRFRPSQRAAATFSGSMPRAVARLAEQPARHRRAEVATTFRPQPAATYPSAEWAACAATGGDGSRSGGDSGC